MPKLSPHGAFSSGMVTLPPSTSSSHQPRSFASSSPLSETEMREPESYGMPGGESEAMSSRSGPASSWACMTLSACDGSSDMPDSP
jgi:hypothetical protein